MNVATNDACKAPFPAHVENMLVRRSPRTYLKDAGRLHISGSYVLDSAQLVRCAPIGPECVIKCTSSHLFDALRTYSHAVMASTFMAPPMASVRRTRDLLLPHVIVTTNVASVRRAKDLMPPSAIVTLSAAMAKSSLHRAIYKQVACLLSAQSIVIRANL